MNKPQNRPLPQADALVSGSGTVYQLTPLSNAACAWLHENVQADTYQWSGPSLCIEWRYVNNIASGMQDAGLIVRRAD